LAPSVTDLVSLRTSSAIPEVLAAPPGTV